MREYVAHVLELMQAWAPVVARSMFGGQGLYRDARMFALIVDDTLYLTAEATTRARFEAARSRPFVYDNRRAGRRTETSYWSAPEGCLEQRAEMAAWCELAWAAALRKAATRKSGARSETRQKAARPRAVAPKARRFR